MSKACPVSMPFWFMSINPKDNNFFSERELYDVVSFFLFSNDSLVLLFLTDVSRGILAMLSNLQK